MRRLLLTAAVVSSLFLGGCEKLMPKEEEPWIPDCTAIQVDAEGTVTETVIDRLDQPYYKAEELTQMIASAILDYTGEHGAQSVVQESLTIENNTVHLVLKYAGPEDYAAFNNVSFFNGTMLGAQMEGYHFETSFYEIGEDAALKEVSGEEALRHKEYQVLVTDLSHAVEVPGDVVYVSTNAHPDGERLVRPGAAGETGQESETQAGLQLPSNAVYIPEKPDDENPEDSYLYIIYKD